MADPENTPESIFEHFKKDLDEARAALEAAEREHANSSAYHAAKELFDTALAAYQKARIDFIPLSPEEKLPMPPLTRAAYSDRMAWLLANMANMAYIGFDTDNPNHEAEKARLEYCLQSGLYGHPNQTILDPQAIAFDLLEIFDTSEGLKKGTKQSDTQAFLAVNQARTFAILSFRGTTPTTWADVRTDLEAVLHKTRQGEVHLGFLDAYREVQTEIHKSLEKIGGIPIYLTGHSLGAALATVATQDLDRSSRYGAQIAACYTYGSPRVGDSHYDDKFKVPIYRIANCTDVVTLLPWLLGEYVHTGDARYLSRATKGKMLYHGIPALRRIWESLQEMLAALLQGHNPLSVWVTAHGMVHYITKLERIAIQRRNL